MGLGRINNYIENLNIGIARGKDWSYEWSPIIPNSQLLISVNDNTPSKWPIEIFINPTDSLWMIILSTVLVLIILGGFIIYFHWKEKIEDRKENEQSYSIF